MEKVVFKCYRNHTHGKHKGKVNPDSIIHITLWRDPSQHETVGSTLKRCKSMFEDSTVKVVIQSAAETPEERALRYKRDGLEVISSHESVESVQAITQPASAASVIGSRTNDVTMVAA